MLAVLAVVCGVVGLLVGSFLNVVIYRVPRGESVVRPRSHCPACGTQLADRDNIPVVSWLLLGGRCRTCREPISARYPLVEAFTGVMFAAVAARLGFDWALPAFLVLTASLIALSVIDLETYRLPVPIVYTTLGLGAVLLAVAGVVSHDGRGIAEAAAGGVLAWAVLLAIHLVSPRGMGFGDVRLAAVVGMFLGWMELPEVGVGLFLSFLFASVVGVGLMVAGRRGRKDRVPFGPFLALGAMVAVFVGEAILDAYLGR